ncbi:PQQ-dependent sugar dehydrogenase [Haloferula sp.]|uniref:PQQ-dependent sugar dehydrogenase n=1 Tax=Haloferula sp. TaxID=2497595 RepID=UPI00329CE193
MKTNDTPLSQSVTNRTADVACQVHPILRVFLLLLAMLATPTQAASPPPSFAVEDIVTNLNQPMTIRFFPDGRLLVGQKKGELQICEVLGTTRNVEEYGHLGDPEHAFSINATNERGLIDVAIDPDFPASPYIYILYTPNSGASGRKGRVARFTHVANSGGTSSRLDMSSEVLIWQDTQGYDSCCHYGGGIDFGPEGKLWITTGDHFQGSYASSLSKAGGKVHRINKDGSIPSDNPFNDGAGSNVDSTFAYGLRNPFRARWDLVDNVFYIAEVGGNTQTTAWEDLHVIRYDDSTSRFIDDDFGTGSDNGTFDGVNFGWPTVEGTQPYSDWPAANIDDVGEPVYAYEHNGNTAAINGGVVYRGTQFPPEYDGVYFFADSTRDFIRYLEFNPDGSVDPNPAGGAINQLNPDPDSYAFDLAPDGRVVAFEVGPDGGLYYVSFTDAGGAFGQPNPSIKGAVRRYVYDGGNLRPELNEFTVLPPTGAAPLSVNFTVEANDLNSDPLTYTLDFGDGSTPATGSIFNNSPIQIGYTYPGEGSYEAVVTIDDGGLTTSDTLTVQVGTPPTILSLTATNDNPVPPTSFFRFGDTYTFAATAEDSDNNPIPAANFTWSISFIRPGNTHPAVGPVDGVNSIDFPIPSQGQGFSGPVYYKAFVTVVDDDGLATTQSIDIFPEKSNITFDTVPSGIVVQVDGNTSIATPFVLDTLINVVHTITVPDSDCVGTTEYLFTGWSNGPSSPQQDYVVPVTDSALTASYVPVGTCDSSTLVTDGLVLQLESDLNVGHTGSDLQTWLDQSGLGNDLEIIGDPQYAVGGTPSGLPVIVLDGTDDGLERVNATDPLGGFPTGNDDRTLFIVAHYPGTADAQTAVAYGKGGFNQAFGIAVQNGTGKLALQGWGNGADLLTNEVVYGAGWSVQSATVGGGEGTIYNDNDEVGQFTHNYNTVLERFVLGEEIAGIGNQEMEIAAVLLYDRELDSMELESVTNYLDAKYLSPNTPPVVSIISPGNGSSYLAGDPISFEALAFDSQEGQIPAGISWSSNLDGVIGTSGDIMVSSLSAGTHVITAEVSDNSNPPLTGSNSITVSVGVSVPVRNGIVVHLESDSNIGTVNGNELMTWGDLSVSANDLSASGDPLFIPGGTPTGLPSLRFDGVGDKLDRVDSIEPLNDLPAGNADRTIVMVANYTGPSSSFAGAAYGNAASNEAFGLVVNHPTGELLLQGYGGGNDAVSATAGIGQGWLIQSATVTGGMGTMYKDSVQIAQFTHNYNTQLDTLVVGEEIGGAGSVAMDVAALLIYDRALSPSELIDVEDYLEEKYISGPVNDMPVVTISSPSDGASFLSVETVNLAASATDEEDGDLGSSIIWTSDINGPIGTGDSISTSSLSAGTHVLTAGATDLGLLTGTDSVTITVTAPTSVLPVSGGVVLHLESTEGVGGGGSTVTDWIDLSGQGNKLLAAGDPQLVAATTPTGQPALSFDGTGDKLERLDATDPLSGLPTGNDDRTMFVVANYPGGSTGFAGVSYGNDATGQTFGVVIEHPGGDLILQGYGATDITTTEPGIGGGWMVQTAMVGGGNGTLFKDGVQIAQAAKTYNTQYEKIVIGEEIGGAGSVTVDVAAVIVYDRVLSISEQAIVEAYLINKYIMIGGGNTPPVVDITGPADTANFTEGESIDFIATAADSEDGDLAASISWTSDIDGAIGTGGTVSTSTLSIGTHTITASVLDGGSLPDSDSITVVVDPPPSMLPVAGGLVLHLESTDAVTAPGGAITEWADLSSEGNNVYASGDPMFVGASTPTGQPSLSLDGVGDKLERVDSSNPLGGLPTGNDDRTMFIVANYPGGSSGSAGVAYGNNAASESFGVVVQDPTGELVLQGYGATDLVTAEPGIGAGWMVQTATVGGGNGTLLKDGVQVGQAAKTYNTVINKIAIGEEIGGLGSVAVDVAAVVIFDRALTPVEQASVEDYLTLKYVDDGNLNVAPVVSISSPSGGASFPEGTDITFTATADDVVDGDLSSSISWSSDVDGALGTGASINTTILSMGAHVITAEVTDSGSLTGTANVAITIDEPIDPSLLAKWNLDEMSGTLAQDAVGSANGGLSAGPVWSPVGGKLNGALDFGGGAERINVPAFDIPGSEMTIAAWVKPQSFAGFADEARYVSKATSTSEQDHYWMMGNFGDGTATRFRLKTSNGGTTTLASANGVLTLNDWNHLAVTYDGANMVIYVNGSQVATGAKTGTISGSGGALIGLGNQPTGAGDRGLDGLLDDVCIFSRALSAGEISDLANPTIPANSPPVIEVTAPANHAEIVSGTNADFTANALDAIDGNISSSVSWSSDIDGPIGSGATVSTSSLTDGEHIITGSVSDAGGLTATDSIVVTVGPASSFLDVTSGLVLRLEAVSGIDAPGGSVTAWEDISGQGNHLFPGGDPSLVSSGTPSGLPAIALDGDDKLERIDSTHQINGLPTGNSDRTMFVVAEYPGVSTAWAGATYGRGAFNKAFGILVTDPDGDLALGAWGGGNDLITTEAAKGVGWMVKCAEVAGGNGTLHKDGIEVGQYAHTFDTEVETIVIGEEISGLGHVEMNVAAVLVYDRALTPTELASVNDYLEQKYLVDGSPIVAISEPLDGATLNEGDSVTFTATATDLIDGDLSGSLAWTSDVDGSIGSGATFDFGALSVGAHTITASVSDTNGGSSSDAIAVTVNAEPVVVISSPLDAALVNEGALVTFAATATDPEEGNVASSLIWTSNLDGTVGVGGTFDSSLLSPGLHTITATATDGNQAEASGSVMITVNPKPVVAISSPTDASTVDEGDSVAFTATANDPEDGDVAASLTWNSDLDGSIGTGATFSSTTLSVGTHVITASATDGNSAVGSETVTITVNAAPVVVISSPTAASTVGDGDSVTFTATATDPEDGDVAASIAWSSDLDGSIGTGATFDSSALSIGVHVITATATDANSETGSSSLTITVSARPIVTISSPANASTVDEGDSVTFTATATDSEDGNVAASLVWVSNLDGSIGTGATFDSTTLSVGSHTITATATDGSSVEGSAMVTITVNAKPIVTISSPTDASTVDEGDSVTFTATATDTEDVDVATSLDWVSDLDGSIGTGATFDTTTLSVGLHTITATATDLNSAEGSDVVTITVNAKPVVTISDPIDASTVDSGVSVTFTATATDTEDVDVATSLNWVSNLDGSIGSGATFDTTALSVGVHTVTATATDSNSATGSSSVTITVDSLYPDGYEDWLTSFGLTGEFEANSDFGKLTNLEEFLLGFDPTNGSDDANFKLICNPGSASVFLHYPELVATGSFHLHMSSGLDDIENIANRIDTITPVMIEAMTPTERVTKVLEVPFGDAREFFVLIFEPTED